MRNAQTLVPTLTLVLLLAGCAGDPADDHPAAQPLQEPTILDFQDPLGPGAAAPLAGTVPSSASANHDVEVPANTTWMAIESTGTVALFLDDPDGKRWCGVRTGRCEVPVNGTGTWSLSLVSIDPADQVVDTVVTFHYNPIPYGEDGTPPSTYTIHATKRRGGEPTLFPLDDGRVLVAANYGVLRLESDGTYTDVTPLIDAQTEQTLDPYLVGDAVTGRVYVSQLAACQRISYTDDAGDSWITNPVACGGPDQHHQKLAAGPDHLGLGTRVLHMLTMNLGSWFATDDVVVTAARSTDSGLTWSQNPAMIPDVHGMEARAIGNVDVADDGSVHAVAYLCQAFNGAAYDGIGAGRSDDGGVTWTWQEIAPGGGDCQGIDPGIAVAGDTLHVVGWDASAGTPALWHVQGSVADASWDKPVAIPTPGLTSFVLAVVDATNDKVVAAFLATPDTTSGPNGAPGWARWYPYVATYEAQNWSVERLEDHPVQLGRICMEGPSCLDSSRNLLDFIDVQIDAEGRAHVAYPDGCPDDCTTAPDSRSAWLRVAVRETE